MEKDFVMFRASIAFLTAVVGVFFLALSGFAFASESSSYGEAGLKALVTGVALTAIGTIAFLSAWREA
jgi:hypothetical protein